VGLVALIARVLVVIVRLWVRTLRPRVLGPQPPTDRPLVFVFHHGRQMGLLRYPRPERTAVLTSLSRDGALQARVLGALGFQVVRGSSSRHGAAGLKGMVEAVRSGAAAAVAVDGPRGPRGEVKPGALFIARASGGVVVPVTTSAAWSIRLSGSWDRFVLPLPWSRMLVLRGEPVEVPRGEDEHLEEARARLQRDLEALTTRADAMIMQET